MATYSSDINNQPAYQQLSVDTKHGQATRGFIDEDGNLDSVFDASLDSGLEMSPHMTDSRRDSSAVGGPALISPPTKVEDCFSSVEMQSLPSNGGWDYQPQHHQEQQQNFFVQGAQIPMAQPWGFNYGNMAMSTQVPRHDNTNIFGHMYQGNQDQNQGHRQTSPQGETSTNQAKSARPVSPTLRAKGDGIRKKNARFPIPENHTLQTIDSLIANESDEKKLKELKSHKRLLRNRQAALDSRQRKKQHTERLEDEKKQYTEAITMLEQEVDAVKVEMIRQRQQYEYNIHELQLERDNMIASHTTETGELRRKVAHLTELVSRYESSSAPATTSSNADFGFDFSMGWENNFLNEFPVEPDSKQEMALTKKEPVESEKSQQGGLLFMLFLVGAFVLSNKSPTPIPRVSDDVRAASATLLDNVLKDAGLGDAQTAMQPLAPQPSGSWTTPAMNDVSMDDSVLGPLGDSLTRPTQEQSNEQLFSLSAAGYNDVNAGFVSTAQPQPSEFPSQGRMNLNDALARVHISGSKSDGAADVYTRSLLWDQVPRDIVREFAEHFRAHRGTANTNPQQNQQQQCGNDIS